jgi:hypothetical protein
VGGAEKEASSRPPIAYTDFYLSHGPLLPDDLATTHKPLVFGQCGGVETPDGKRAVSALEDKTRKVWVPSASTKLAL